jgi:hypothetical protein
MSNNPPPYSDITGISRTVMKDNAQESITDYNGNARPGEMVVDLNNNNIYIGNINGGLELINTGGGSGNAEPAGSVGAVQLNAGGNLFGASANLTFVNDSLVTGNVIPSADDTYFLGNSTNRWANIWLGPGTIYITDTGNVANVAELTVNNGVLFVNGAAGVQANLINGTTSLTLTNNGNVAISVGGTANSMVVSSTGATINGNTVVGNSKSFTMTGSQVVSTLYQDGGSFPTAPNLDLTKQVHKLADSDFVLPDGVEGQICYFVMNDASASAEDTYVQVNHLRISQGGGANVRVNAVWQPFPFGAGNYVATLSTAIFTDGAWSVNAGAIV